MSLAVLAFASCTDDKVKGPDVEAVINLSTYDLRFTSPNDSSLTVSVESSVDWTTIKNGDEDAEWITITPSEGKGKNEATEMVIHVTENLSNTERVALVLVSAVKGSAAKELTIKQSPVLGKLGKDSMVLIQFYEATEGWTWKIPWVIEEPISTWPGVSVSIAEGELRVTKLNLEGYMGNDITGALPENFQELDQLTQLQSYANNHEGPLPEWLPKLTKLTDFCLASCNISGPIPESYWDMTQLVHMRLESNGIKGPLSEGIGKLVNLQEIKLHDTSLGGKVPGSIGKMTALRDIDLFNCKLEGELPAEIGEAPNLENIRFDKNPKLSGAIPEQWGDLKKLRILHIEDCPLITSLPKSFSKCQAFWEMNLANCVGITEIPTEWIESSKLERIQAYGSGLTSLPQWEKHPFLSAIDAQNCKLECAIPPFVAHLVNAYLSNNEGLTGPIPESMYTTERLQDLSIVNCKNVTGELRSEFWLRPTLVNIELNGSGLTGELPLEEEYKNASLKFQHINMAGCKFSGPLPNNFFVCAPNLQYVNIKSNDFSGTLPVYPGNKANLATLNISDNLFTGVVPDSYRSHAGWSSVNMWDPENNICPQRGTGFTSGCEESTWPER